MLGNFWCLCCCLLTFFSKLTFGKNTSNFLDPDQEKDCGQDHGYVNSDLDPNCLQSLSEVAASKGRVIYLYNIHLYSIGNNVKHIW